MNKLVTLLTASPLEFARVFAAVTSEVDAPTGGAHAGGPEVCVPAADSESASVCGAEQPPIDNQA